MPSPAIATMREASRNRRTSSIFWSGPAWACTSSIPSCRATMRAVCSLSPVNITIFKPIPCSRRMAAGVVDLTVSATASAPAMLPSRATNITVCPND